MNLSGSKTEKNLLKTFANEARGLTKYTLFAEKALDEGYEEVAEDFMEIALEELAHAREVFGRYLNLVKSTSENLDSAVKGETDDYSDLYVRYENDARDEGFEDIANFYKKLIEVEREHSEFFGGVKDSIKYDDTRDASWRCLNCGNVIHSREIPESCELCKHSKDYIIRNYVEDDESDSEDDYGIYDTRSRRSRKSRSPVVTPVPPIGNIRPPVVTPVPPIGNIRPPVVTPVPPIGNIRPPVKPVPPIAPLPPKPPVKPIPPIAPLPPKPPVKPIPPIAPLPPKPPVKPIPPIAPLPPRPPVKPIPPIAPLPPRPPIVTPVPPIGRPPIFPRPPFWPPRPGLKWWLFPPFWFLRSIPSENIEEDGIIIDDNIWE